MALRHALAGIMSAEELLARYFAALPAWHPYLTDSTFDAGWDRVRHAFAARLADLYPNRDGAALRGAVTTASSTIQALRNADSEAGKGRVLRDHVKVTEALLAGTLFDAVIHVPLRIANKLAADPTEVELLDHMLLIATVLQLSKNADWTESAMYLALIDSRGVDPQGHSMTAIYEPGNESSAYNVAYRHQITALAEAARRTQLEEAALIWASVGQALGNGLPRLAQLRGGFSVLLVEKHLGEAGRADVVLQSGRRRVEHLILDWKVTDSCAQTWREPMQQKKYRDWLSVNSSGGRAGEVHCSPTRCYICTCSPEPRPEPR